MSNRKISILALIFLAALPGLALGNGAKRRVFAVVPHLDSVRLSVPTIAQAGEQSASPDGKILYYQDPMHPWYKSDKPGIAPDCGMKLVPIYAGDAPVALPPEALRSVPPASN